MQQPLFTLTLLAALAPYPALAWDAACDPLVKASEAKIAQPAWHSITNISGMKKEAIKVNGKSFLLMGDKWQKAPMDWDKAEQIGLDQMKTDAIKVTACKNIGSETLDGVETDIFSFITEAVGSGIPAVTATVHLGKDDHLPYKQTDESGVTQVTWHYKDVAIPTSSAKTTSNKAIPTACTLVTAAEVQTAFGQTVETMVDEKDTCIYNGIGNTAPFTLLTITLSTSDDISMATNTFRMMLKMQGWTGELVDGAAGANKTASTHNLTGVGDEAWLQASNMLTQATVRKGTVVLGITATGMDDRYSSQFETLVSQVVDSL